MGKYKFRFSDMIPNAWLYKLRHMSSSSSSSSLKQCYHLHPRKSHYFTRELPDHEPPRHKRAATSDTYDHFLPPIKTKPPTYVKRQHQPPRNANANANVATSSGVRLRVNSPKFGGRRVLTGRGGKTVRSQVSRGSLVYSDSFAVVKTSMDPYGDFKTSMMEMIVEKGIRAEKDLEELLACYLWLNSQEYHHLIVTAFKHIWFDFISLTPQH